MFCVNLINVLNNCVTNPQVLQPTFTFKFSKEKNMKKKLLFSIILAAGLTLGNFSGYQVNGQTPAQGKSMKQQTVKYTCPMHPEIRSDKEGKCPKCGMDLIKVEKASDTTIVKN